MKKLKKKTGVFIVPRSSFDWKGNEAGWITASGWASAGERLWGNSIVATTDGIFIPQQSRLFPQISSNNKLPKSLIGFRKFIPEIFITAYKDWRIFEQKPQIWPIEKSTTLSEDEVMLIWERHDLFPGPGRRIANKLGVPLVTSVEALAVWEAKKWGVKRPFWGNWLERNVEAKSLKKSDLVCCVSQEVKDKVVSLGVKENKVIVTPNRVDGSLFNPQINGSKIREKYGLNNKIVLGWTGSFRKFHAIDDVIHAFNIVHNKHQNTVLMLVGDGMEYSKIEEMIDFYKLTDSVIMPGRKSFVEIPNYVANFDISLVSARTAEDFHYSPLKLREYLAAGKAVIAPNAGNIPSVFQNEKDLLLYEAGSYMDLSEKLLMLLNNKKLHFTLQSNAEKWFKREGSWEHELKRVCDLLQIPY